MDQSVSSSDGIPVCNHFGKQGSTVQGVQMTKHDDDVVAYVMHVAAFERGAVVCIKL